MGSKASTPATPVSEDSSSSQPIYSTSDRFSDYEQPSRQGRQERSFMERAETSLQNLIHYSTGGSSNVDIQRGSREHSVQDRLTSSFDETGRQPRPSSIANNSSRSFSIGSTPAAGQADSTSSSVGSNSGLSQFFSNFSLWRASGPSSSDRQRAQSLSNMPDQGLANPNQPSDSSRSRYDASSEEASSFSNPRAVLNRLLSSRETRGAGASTGAESSHLSRRDSAFRDLSFAAAQEFLTEATLNGLGLGRVYVTHSLPSHMWAVNGIKCPVCSKFVMPDDIECHLVMCLTKPRLTYNEDVLTEDKDECVICLEDLLKGHVIARLPCLCVYHKSCIDQWFDVNRSCPEHPSD